MAKVVIDPGHGGTDSGAIGNGIVEKDLNLKISKYIYDIGKIITGKTPRTSIADNYGGNIPFLTPSDDLTRKHVVKTGKTLTVLEAFKPLYSAVTV